MRRFAQSLEWVDVLTANVDPSVLVQKSHFSSRRAVAKTEGEGVLAARESCWPAMLTPLAPALGMVSECVILVGGDGEAYCQRIDLVVAGSYCPTR